MKVLVVGSYDRSLVNFRGPLIKTMAKRGHEVVACAPGLSEATRNTLRSYGARSCAVALSRTGLNPIRDIGSVADLYRTMRRERPQRVLTYTVKPVVYGALAARYSGTPGYFPIVTGLGFAFATDGSLTRRIISRTARRLYKTAMRQSSAAFFQNPDDLEEFKRFGLMPKSVRPVMINGSGVDTDHFSRAPLPDATSFLLIARLLADKGIREFVDAARIVRNRFPGTRFRLAGWLEAHPSAIRESELRSWIDEGVVSYLGELDDVRPALAECRIYVLPSYREGTPRTVLEAMSTGRPVITTHAPGCRETVRDGVNGYLVPVRDVEQLARAMMRFLEQPDLAATMGGEARRVAEDKYDVHKVNEVILDSMGL